MVRLFTIGSTRKSARVFFGLLKESGATGVVDVRLHNLSQLAGFAKRDDLEFFLREICQMEYRHLPQLAPSESILEEYRKHGGGWDRFSAEFLTLIRERRIDESLRPAELDNRVLLCGEEKAEHCHRRVVAEYLRERWGDVEITHLG